MNYFRPKPILAQEFISGEEYNVIGLGDGKGNDLGQVSIKKMLVTKLGKIWTNVSIRNPKLSEFATSFVKQSGWAGGYELELMQKFGTEDFYLIEINPRNVKDEIDGANVDDMLQQYGSPLFIFSERQLRRQIRRLKQAFQTRYPAMVFSWSYKTNYLSAICALFHQEGEIAEVVSGFEYAKARKLGMPGNKIVFNGPLKTDEELKVAFSEGAKVHIDNFAELQRAEKVAQSLGKKCPVGIRLNIDTGLYQCWTKFGFNLENSQAYEAASLIARSEWLELTGIHAHIGTFMLDSNPYKIQVEKLVGFMFRVEEQLNCNIEYLDLGGGFPSKNKLKGVYHSPEINIPEIEEFAEVISSALLNSLPPGRTPTVYLETGRHLVDDAGYFSGRRL